ncbi:MAG TPA: hypothetical protein VKU02_27245 [Gemmataceae bacterium]|nr:hypothetical protein [Gemmataceae bacterium]
MRYGRAERGRAMTITLTPDIEQAVIEEAQHRGTTPESLALEVLREKFVPCRPATPLPPQALDDWERTLLNTGTSCGISLPHEAVGSEGLYD